MIEEQVLSKVLDDGNVYEMLKFNIGKQDFPTQGNVFEYIVDYYDKFEGVPDITTVSGEFDDFEYLANVNEPFKGLATRLKQQTAKRKAVELLQREDLSEKVNKMNGQQFVRWFKEEFDKIEKMTSSDYTLGTNFALNGEDRRKSYLERKEKRTHQYIPYPYKSMNEWLYGMELGDYILLMAYTNRGKSWIGSHIGQHAWRNNFNVLHYSPELSKTQQQSRIETLDGHFNNSELKRAMLEDDDAYFKYLEQFTPKQAKSNYIIKTMEDLPKGLSTSVIEADLEVFEDIDLVIIDGFNLMTHGGKDGNRNNMSNTSRKLRQIFGRYGVAGLVIHQTPNSAEKENKEEDEGGTRVVKPPTIDQYSETIAVIQDASTVLTFDQHDGIGKLAIRKAREPYVNEVVDLQCNFNLGFIEEPKATDMF